MEIPVPRVTGSHVLTTCPAEPRNIIIYVWKRNLMEIATLSLAIVSSIQLSLRDHYNISSLYHQKRRLVIFLYFIQLHQFPSYRLVSTFLIEIDYSRKSWIIYLLKRASIFLHLTTNILTLIRKNVPRSSVS